MSRLIEPSDWIDQGTFDLNDPDSSQAETIVAIEMLIDSARDALQTRPNSLADPLSRARWRVVTAALRGQMPSLRRLLAVLKSNATEFILDAADVIHDLHQFR